MNQTTGDSRKQQINGAALLKEGDEKKPIQAIEETDFETGTLVKLAENPETSVEIKTGDVEMVRLTKKEDGIDAIYIPARDEVLVVDHKEITPEQHAAIKAKYEAYKKKAREQKEGPQI